MKREYEKKLCEIGAKINHIKVETEKLDDMTVELIHDLIDDNPIEMDDIIRKLIKDELL